MKMKIPFLDNDFITKQAQTLLDEFGLNHEPITSPPVPVDDILELHLKFSLDLEDLGKEHGLPGVDGFTSVATRKVFVHQRLDPVVHRKMEGRFNFTVAHEIGHIRLHEHWLRNDEFQRHATSPAVCNLLGGLTPDEYDRLETQANKFAGELLMPWRMVRQIAAAVLHHRIKPAVGGVMQMAQRSQSHSTEWTSDQLNHQLVEHFISEMACVFKASVPAMQRQLESLGIVVTDDRGNLHTVDLDPLF